MEEEDEGRRENGRGLAAGWERTSDLLVAFLLNIGLSIFLKFLMSPISPVLKL